MERCRRFLRRRISVITQTIATVEPGGILIGTQQRLVSAGIHRHLLAAEFDDIEGVACGLLDRHVPRDGRYGDDLNVGRAHGHDERDGIVGSRVGVNQEGARHARMIANGGVLYCHSRRCLMSRIVRCGLIQAKNPLDGRQPLTAIKKAMIDKHLKMIEQAAKKKVKILCLQELFYGPYFCAEQNVRWYELTERVPDGPTTKLMQKLAAKYRMVMVVPVYEEQMPGLYFNTAAVIDADGKYLGKYRKHHIPHVHPGFWEKFYFTPGDMGYSVFETKYARVGVYICYDRHFPEGARILGLNGAEIVFNPSATVAGLSEYLWELEQPAHAVANGYFVGAINRVGTEKPWSIGEFYGKSYFCNPRGKIIAQASRDKDEVIVADLDLDIINEVRRVWQFFRDRRPDTYAPLTEQTGRAVAAD
jgi:beta-ureidopropionase